MYAYKRKQDYEAVAKKKKKTTTTTKKNFLQKMLFKLAQPFTKMT